MNECIFVYQSNGMDFPVFYDELWCAWWTPRIVMWFDTLDELKASADALSGAAFIA